MIFCGLYANRWRSGLLTVALACLGFGIGGLGTSRVSKCLARLYCSTGT